MTGRKLVVIGLAVVLAFSLLAAGCKGGGGAPQEATAPATPTPGSAAEPAAPTPPAGQPAAAEAKKPAVPIEIVAYYPLNESHKFIADYVKSVEAANPGKITVSVYDMQSEEGRKKWMSSGLSCAGVFVNGKTSYELTTNGKKETVAFLQRMDVMWTHEDFETVLKQILDKAGQTFVSPKYVSPKPPATTGAAGANPEATPKAKPSGSAG